MTWNRRRVFVTGATGVIGSALTRQLIAEGADVSALIFERPDGSDLVRSGDINKIKQIDGRLEDGPLLDKTLTAGNFEAVFHLGAQALVESALTDPVATFETNIKGTYNLLDACRKVGGIKAIVVASSDKAYGAKDALPYTEDMALEGRFPYEVSKSCTDLISLAYHRTYALPVAVTRCGNVYGPGDLNWSRIVPGTIKSLLTGERPVIRSDGKFKRDYIFVKDIAAAYLQTAEALLDGRCAGEAFNFAAEAPLNVLEIVEAISTALNVSLEPDIRHTAKHEIRDQYLDCSKAREALAWKPGYTLEDGLAETIAWYKDYL
ncbi:MAG: sugar dehydratase [Elusimicrobia bacterium]|nr:MAG: sugar dehydratase [Elusimicrobiota bacterium]